jgi:serine/threonine protein kinase
MDVFHNIINFSNGVSEERFLVVVELCQGDLFDYIIKAPGHSISELSARCVSHFPLAPHPLAPHPLPPHNYPFSHFMTILSADGDRIAFRSIVMAIGALHAHGVVHRDIKPDNILIDMAGTFKIADFGWAKVLSSSASTNTSILGLAGPLYYPVYNTIFVLCKPV